MYAIAEGISKLVKSFVRVAKISEYFYSVGLGHTGLVLRIAKLGL
jgi:hypothetical protein